MTNQTSRDIPLEGTYTLSDDTLKNEILTLKVGVRHRPKKGQAHRFIGYVDLNKPEDEQYTYISSLYSVQGTKNIYSLEYAKQRYVLNMSGFNSVEIAKEEKEKALVFKP